MQCDCPLRPTRPPSWRNSTILRWLLALARQCFFQEPLEAKSLSPKWRAKWKSNGKLGTRRCCSILRIVSMLTPLPSATSRTRPLSHEHKKTTVVGLRDFFRFAFVKGYHKKNLSLAVPSVMEYRLARVPKALPWDTVEKLLKVPDRKCAIGRRDYALPQIFATYGVRRCQVPSWKRGVLAPTRFGRTAIRSSSFLNSRALATGAKPFSSTRAT